MNITALESVLNGFILDKPDPLSNINRKDVAGVGARLEHHLQVIGQVI